MGRKLRGGTAWGVVVRRLLSFQPQWSLREKWETTYAGGHVVPMEEEHSVPEEDSHEDTTRCQKVFQLTSGIFRIRPTTNCMLTPSLIN